MMRITTYKSYQVGSGLDLTQAQIQQLISLLNRRQTVSDTPLGDPGKPLGGRGKPLGGRGALSRASIDGIGSIAVKHYKRGGLVRHVVRSKYLKWGDTRGLKEYEILQTVRNLGINAPEPLIWVYRGKLVYSAWLVTRHIMASKSLTQLSLENEDLAVRAMQSAVDQMMTLVQNKILHVDLHPGNVLVDPEGKVYLLDFDKGRIFRGSRQQLQERYFARWKRAVIKHGLPAMLIDRMRNGIEDVKS